MRRLAGLVVVGLIACGRVDMTGRYDRLAQPIIGGELSLNDDAVFALGTARDGMFCTATLIGERTLLTAAHCIDGATGFSASNHPDVRAWPLDAIPAVESRTHPRWKGNGDWDVGLVLLDSAPQGVTPKVWNRAPLTSAQLTDVRALGFGETHASGSGVRMSAMLEVTAIGADTLYLGGGDAGTATCFGDSGGPAMHTGTDGVERVVGVHSFSFSTACSGGGDLRVDAVAEFIDQWTRDKAPTCATDGACAQGCPVTDLDCFCVADGKCLAQCPLPDTDSDCGKNCLADDVCAYGTCGIADPDCLVDGDFCSSAEHCAGHQCLTDALHTMTYCSRTCSVNVDCDPDMLCTFGVCQYPVLPLAEIGEVCEVGRTLCRGGVCSGQSVDAALCRLPCHPGDSACPDGMRCVNGVRGVRYCQGTAVVRPVSTLRADAASTCSVAPGGLAVALAALLLLRRRSRA